MIQVIFFTQIFKELENFADNNEYKLSDTQVLDVKLSKNN